VAASGADTRRRRRGCARSCACGQTVRRPRLFSSRIAALRSRGRAADGIGSSWRVRLAWRAAMAGRSCGRCGSRLKMSRSSSRVKPCWPMSDPIVRVRLSTGPSRAGARPLADRVYVTPETAARSRRSVDRTMICCGRARAPSAAPALAAAPDRGDLAPFPFPCRAVVGQRDVPHDAPQGRQDNCSGEDGDRRGDRGHLERLTV